MFTGMAWVEKEDFIGVNDCGEVAIGGQSEFAEFDRQVQIGGYTAQVMSSFLPVVNGPQRPPTETKQAAARHQIP